MGLITINTEGSFGDMRTGNTNKVFSADNGGHADAISQAIEFMSKELLPAAIERDVALSRDNVCPEKPFGRGRDPLVTGGTTRG